MKKEYDILTTVTMDRDNFFDYITEGLIDHLPAKVPQIENKRGKNNFTYNGKDYLIEAFDTEIELVNSIARTYKQPTRNYRLKCLNGESEIDALSYASTKRDLVDSINFNLKSQWTLQYKNEAPEFWELKTLKDYLKNTTDKERAEIFETALNEMEYGLKKWDAIIRATGYYSTPSGKLVKNDYIQEHKNRSLEYAIKNLL